MRVALDVTPLVGPGTGVATFVRGLAGALGRRGEVELSAYGLTWRGRGALAAAVPPGLALARRPMPARPLSQAWARAGWPPAEWWTGPVEVVHGTNFVVPATRGAAAVVTVHDLTAVRFPHLCTPASRRYPGLIRAAVGRGAWVHTPSRFVADEVVDLLGVPPERVHAVLSGIDPAGPAGDAGRGWALAGSTRFVLALGTVEPRKGLVDLVRAFDRLAAERPELALVVAGPDGWGTDAFTAATALARHGGRIRRLGWVDAGARADLLAGATVVAVPSVYEGFGFPALEAMAAGTAVVATAAGSLPEVVGPAGRLVPVGDVDALASALAEVVDDPALRAEMGRAGPAHAGRFRWDDCASGILRLYREAAGT